MKDKELRKLIVKFMNGEIDDYFWPVTLISLLIIALFLFGAIYFIFFM